MCSRFGFFGEMLAGAGTGFEFLDLRGAPGTKWRVEFTRVPLTRNGKQVIFFSGLQGKRVTALEGVFGADTRVRIALESSFFGDADLKITVGEGALREVADPQITSFTLLPALDAASTVVVNQPVGVDVQRSKLLPNPHETRVSLAGYQTSGSVSGQPGGLPRTKVKLSYKLIFTLAISLKSKVTVDLLNKTHGLSFEFRAREHYPQFHAKVQALPVKGQAQRARFSWSTTHETSIPVVPQQKTWNPKTHQLSTGFTIVGGGGKTPPPLKHKQFFCNVKKLQEKSDHHNDTIPSLDEYSIGVVDRVGIGARFLYAVTMLIEAEAVGRTAKSTFNVSSAYLSLDVVLECPLR